MIKTIIFDFAGVIATKKCFPAIADKLSEKLGIDKDLILEQLYDNEEEYVLGNESLQDFWEKSIKKIDISYPDFETIFSSWYELNNDVIDLIKELKKDYQMIILSDNFDVATPIMRKDENFNYLFEEMIFSNEVHLTKKYKEIFEYTLEKIDKKPSECLFIDDKKKNLLPAKEIGINTILFTDFKKFKKDLNYLLQ